MPSLPDDRPSHACSAVSAGARRIPSACLEGVSTAAHEGLPRAAAICHGEFHKHRSLAGPTYAEGCLGRTWGDLEWRRRLDDPILAIAHVQARQRVLACLDRHLEHAISGPHRDLYWWSGRAGLRQHWRDLNLRASSRNERGAWRD